MTRQVPCRGHCIHARAAPFHLPVSLISGREDLQILTTAHRGRRRMSWREPGEHMALSRTRTLPNRHLIHKYLIECSRRTRERVLLFPKMVCRLRRMLPRPRMNSTMSPPNWLDLKRIMLFAKSTTRSEERRVGKECRYEWSRWK